MLLLNTLKPLQERPLPCGPENPLRMYVEKFGEESRSRGREAEGTRRVLDDKKREFNFS